MARDWAGCRVVAIDLFPGGALEVGSDSVGGCRYGCETDSSGIGWRGDCQGVAEDARLWFVDAEGEKSGEPRYGAFQLSCGVRLGILLFLESKAASIMK